MASRLSEGGIYDGIFDNHLAHIGKIPYPEDLRTKYKTYKTPHSFETRGYGVLIHLYLLLKLL
jgi:hypothetical protein